MNIKKILLISPPAYTFKTHRDINPLPPMGLGYIASVAENLDIEVEILDCLVEGWDVEEDAGDLLIKVGLSDKAIKGRLEAFKPDIVGINCQFSRQHKIYHKMLSLVKEFNPKCITIVGGAHATVCPEDILKDPSCDFVLIGEAEESFKDLLLALNEDKDIEKVDGLGWKTKGKLHVNEKRKWTEDLDSIQFPAYHLMGLDKYFGLNASHGIRLKEKFSPIITSRGCPAKCTFCTAKKVWGMKYRVRSVENVIDEMKLLRNKYGIEELMFEDDNVTVNPKRAKSLFLRMIEENFKFTWDTPNGVGVWSLDKEFIDLMKQSGCTNLNFPVESGSQFVLDNIIKKPLKLTKVKELINYCKEIKLNYGMFLVIGMPGEKVKDMWESYRFAADCGCYKPHISVATPYPGSALFKECIEKGLFYKPFKMDDLFISSYMIKTDDWDGQDLNSVLKKGRLYLKYREVIGEPLIFFKWVIYRLKNPLALVRLIKRLCFN